MSGLNLINKYSRHLRRAGIGHVFIIGIPSLKMMQHLDQIFTSLAPVTI